LFLRRFAVVLTSVVLAGVGGGGGLVEPAADWLFRWSLLVGRRLFCSSGALSEVAVETDLALGLSKLKLLPLATVHGE